MGILETRRNSSLFCSTLQDENIGMGTNFFTLIMGVKDTQDEQSRDWQRARISKEDYAFLLSSKLVRSPYRTLLLANNGGGGGVFAAYLWLIFL